jgi:2,4-didehydro-3-deoxy-L-rhamnonate hydrolase
MKLARIGSKGAERPVLVDAAGILRDLSAVERDIDAHVLSPEGLTKLAALDPITLPHVPDGQRYGVPFTGVGKFVAIGLNYREHASEANMALPDEPIIFQKAITSLSGPDDDVIMPPGGEKLDWEVELGIVIGTRAAYVERSNALDHVAGYVIVNDVSERAFQLERGGTWDKGKSCDSFGPVGPWLVTPDELPGLDALDLTLDVNGVRMQSGSTADFIFDVATVVSYVSQFMSLEPGDIIATGTPAGVGMGKKPAPIFLKIGDEMRVSITGLGEQRQRVVGYDRNKDVAA